MRRGWMNKRRNPECYGQKILKIDVVPVPVMVPVGLVNVVVEEPPNEGVVVAVLVEMPVGLRNVVEEYPPKDGVVVAVPVVTPVGLRNMIAPLCPQLTAAATISRKISSCFFIVVVPYVVLFARSTSDRTVSV